MDLQTLTFLIVGLTFAVYIGIAFWAKASSTNEFYVAGGGVSPIANGMATAADWMSAASFISMAGMISFLGYGGSVFLMGWTGGYVLLALLLALFWNRLNIINNKSIKPFKYKDKGSLATVGKRKAVADLGKFKFAGYFAWLLWSKRIPMMLSSSQSTPPSAMS